MMYNVHAFAIEIQPTVVVQCGIHVSQTPSCTYHMPTPSADLFSPGARNVVLGGFWWLTIMIYSEYGRTRHVEGVF